MTSLCVGIVPDILYDERSLYRQEYVKIPPPYSEQLPWKPNSCKTAAAAARGISKTTCDQCFIQYKVY